MDIGLLVYQFVAENNGQHIDEDGYFGAQCWDVVAKFARVKIGCPFLPTGSGGAEGLYRVFAQPIPQYFDRVGPADLQKGDIAVWPAEFSPPWGHTALVIERRPGGIIRVLEQNGNNPGGVSYIRDRYASGTSGGLRAKGANMAVNPNRGDVENIIGELWGRAPNGEDFNYTNDNWHDFIYGVLAAYPYQDRKKWFAQLVVDNDRLKQDLGTVQSIANIRGDNFNQIAKALGVTVDPDESITTKNIIAEIQRLLQLGPQLTAANSALAGLKAQIDELSKKPSDAEIAALRKSADDANAAAMKAQAELEKIKAQQAIDQETGNSFLRWLGSILSKLKGSS